MLHSAKLIASRDALTGMTRQGLLEIFWSSAGGFWMDVVLSSRKRICSSRLVRFNLKDSNSFSMFPCGSTRASWSMLVGVCILFIRDDNCFSFMVSSGVVV